MTANRAMNALPDLRAVWATKVMRFRPYLQEGVSRQCFYAVPISTLVDWHPEAHGAVLLLVATKRPDRLSPSRQ